MFHPLLLCGLPRIAFLPVVCHGKHAHACDVQLVCLLVGCLSTYLPRLLSLDIVKLLILPLCWYFECYSGVLLQRTVVLAVLRLTRSAILHDAGTVVRTCFGSAADSFYLLRVIAYSSMREDSFNSSHISLHYIISFRSCISDNRTFPMLPYVSVTTSHLTSPTSTEEA